MKIAKKPRSLIRKEYDRTNHFSISCKSGECYLETDTPLSGLQIKFRGRAIITSTLPENWVVRAKKKQIIIFNINGQEIGSTLLFSYEGNITLKSVIGCDKDSERISGEVQIDKQTWDNPWNFNENTSKWNDLKQNTNTTNKKSIRTIANVPVDRGFKTDGGEYLLNGKNYIGKYHIQKDIGIAMTVSNYTHTSKILVRKEDYNPQTKQIQKQTKSRSTIRQGGTGGGGF